MGVTGLELVRCLSYRSFNVYTSSCSASCLNLLKNWMLVVLKFCHMEIVLPPLEVKPRGSTLEEIE